MAPIKPLTGMALINCAKANANQGLGITTHQCGYDQNFEAFLIALQTAGQTIGVKITTFDDLICEDEHLYLCKAPGLQVAPESLSTF